MSSRRSGRVHKRDASQPARSRPTTPAPDALEIHWRGTRSGARAARGFHYQEDVGVLLAARLVAGASGASSVVPEGYEDYSLEGGNADQVQVKSRQVSRGHFTPNEVAGFVTKVCEALQRRRDDGAAGAPVLMLEVGVATTDPDWGSGSRIGELPAGSPAAQRCASTRPTGGRARRRL